MKIVLINAFYLGEGRGVGNYIEKLLFELSRCDLKNIKIIVICKNRGQKVSSFNKNIIFFHLISVPFPIWENFVIPIMTLIIRPDVVHFPANSSSFLPVVGRRLVTIHDVIFLQPKDVVPYSTIIRQRIGRIYLAINVAVMVKFNKKILTVSQTSKRDLVKLARAEENKIAVIYEGPGNIFNRSRLPFEKRRIILHFASDDPRKNTIRTVEAFIKSKAPTQGFVLHLIGEIKNLGVQLKDKSENIRFHNFLSEQSLQDIVSQTAILVYPSMYEGFGMPIIEFQRIGVAVITSKTSACGEIGAIGSVLVEPTDVNSIVNAIDLLCRSDFQDKYIQKGLENAEMFRWDKCAEATLQEYKNA